MARVGDGTKMGRAVNTPGVGKARERPLGLALGYNLSMKRDGVAAKLIVVCACLVALAGCARPKPAATPLVPTLDVEALRQTSVAQVTLSALQTLAAKPVDTLTPEIPATPAPPTLIPTIARSATPQPTETPQGACNQVGTGTPFDLTIPDGTVVLPGQAFTKTWRLVNAGTCTWNRLYKLIFFSGNSMNAHQEQYLSVDVKPGDAIDLSVNFTAPNDTGQYQSNWMLLSADGEYFGLGRNGDGPFWVKIQVVKAFTPTP